MRPSSFNAFTMNENYGNNRRPADAYLVTSFILLGIMQLINILLSSCILFVILPHRCNRTISNILTANSSLAVLIFSLAMAVQLAVGIAKDSKENQAVCNYLSYLTSLAAGATCYSYLTRAVSQYFFTILHRRHLLTVRVHYYLVSLTWLLSALMPLVLRFSGKLTASCERNA